MVARTLAIKPADMPKELDASDGVAVALCHHFQLASPRMQADTAAGRRLWPTRVTGLWRMKARGIF